MGNSKRNELIRVAKIMEVSE